MHGKHVLVEKPITETNDEALELYDLASKKKKVLMVGHTFEYTGAVNKIKDIVENNGIGNYSISKHPGSIWVCSKKT